ncbi:MAG: sulfurtransferase complex subunit TusC [Cellvibrionaceae bacterium]|nr:sulfurtransferase complex subunit TusC [Cellvibrionaceae bacterium]
MTAARPKNIGFLLCRAPYASQCAQEALEALLAASAYGQTLSVIFMNEGVWQLTAGQNNHRTLHHPAEARPHGAINKNIEKMLKALRIYEIDRCYVCAESLRCRHITPADLSITAECLTRQPLLALLRQQDTLLSY